MHNKLLNAAASLFFLAVSAVPAHADDLDEVVNYLIRERESELAKAAPAARNKAAADTDSAGPGFPGRGLHSAGDCAADERCALVVVLSSAAALSKPALSKASLSRTHERGNGAVEGGDNRRSKQ